MTILIVEISKYLMMFLFALYTFMCFAVFRGNRNQKKKDRLFLWQRVLMYAIHFSAFLALYAVQNDWRVIIFYLFQVILISIVLTCYQLFYSGASMLLANNMCMLLIVGFTMLTRLSIERAIKQYIIALAAVVLTLVIPLMIHKLTFLKRMTWVYALVGIAGLSAVAVLGKTSYGAKISISIAGLFTIQPSEFIKILFVFFVACMLWRNPNFKTVCITTAVAAVHVLILVMSRDLGGALIYFITYLIMLYVATKKLFYFASGILCGSIAAMIAYQMFTHVQVRVVAWKDPLRVIDNEGYQICQSLFAIGTGGWFGMGLGQGTPNKIPVVEQDFIFSAIAEEMGTIFALCLIMVCASCFLIFLNVAMQMKDRFYKLLALGFGIVYGFQIFLTIGGAIKLIPSTGVTLPLVSYGGSSLLATMIIFAVIQGLCVLRQDEGEDHERKKQGQAYPKIQSE